MYYCLHRSSSLFDAASWQGRKGEGREEAKGDEMGWEWRGEGSVPPFFYNVATVYIATLLSADATQIVKYNYSLTKVYDGD